MKIICFLSARKAAQTRAKRDREREKGKGRDKGKGIRSLSVPFSLRSREIESVV